MNLNTRYCYLSLIGILLINIITPRVAAHSEIREKQLEEALLQQLHSVIISSLKDIYKTEDATFHCERISNINERVTVKRIDKGSIRADALHGAKYFEITVSLCNVGVKKDHVELYLKNDSPTAEFYLVGYNIIPND
ncbi:hypothetical protein P4H70_19220 [Paenibacillus ehimensis]|uniref:hypothetical protein n=1 Tax=Paenibacillus ehimensis TaxID=79264 RepID=UPI002DB5CA4C|nr:hypothetical protein [Paenibacillus ehimensis]MEC0211073.1 hypothetical protein [Paenibacillus ehimensis]